MLVLPDANLWRHRRRQLVGSLQDDFDRNNVCDLATSTLSPCRGLYSLWTFTNISSTSTATVGVSVLFVSSIPLCLEKGAGFPGLIVALFIIGLG